MSRFSRVIAVLLLVTGAGYVAAAAVIPAKAVLAQVLIGRAFDRQLAGDAEGADRALRPWPWADTIPVARLTFAASGRSMVVLSGAGGGTLAFGPGHITGTAAPGEPGNIALAGHRDTHFSVLQQVAIGDRLILESRAGAVSYAVTERWVTDQADVSPLGPTRGNILTLVTCYPFDAVVPGGRGRYVVRAEAVTAGGRDVP